MQGEDRDGLLKACALIRSNLHIDATMCDEEDFAMYYGQALWLEEIRLKNQADLLLRLFGADKS